MSGPTLTTREQFMETVRRALGRRGPLAEAPVPPVVDDALVRLTGPGEDLVDLFAERAAQVGMAVRRTTAQGLPTQVLDALRECGATSITLAIDRLEMKEALAAALTEAGIELRPWAEDRSMAAHYEAHAGVSDVHAALAETGTLICCSDAAHGRGHSLVPPVHIAIVRRTDILPDLLDYVAALRGVAGPDLPSAIALITGPSKTADIEGILITGVHGPGRVVILLVEDQ
jgi:L-lactate dehydrogenase complex protein LldG